MWPLAAKYLQVPLTEMSCTPIGKFDAQRISFAFDGKTIQAGSNSFSQADSANAETLIIDPNSSAAVVYSVNKADGNGVSLGLSQPNVLAYASIDLPGNEHLLCTPK